MTDCCWLVAVTVTPGGFVGLWGGEAGEEVASGPLLGVTGNSDGFVGSPV